LKYLVQKQ